MIQQKVCVSVFFFFFFFKCPVAHPKAVLADGCLYLSLVLSEVSFLPSHCHQVPAQRGSLDCWSFLCVCFLPYSIIRLKLQVVAVVI